MTTTAHKLSITTQGTLSRTIDLRFGINRIGRNPLNDHVFNDPAISGFHCEIEVTSQGILVRDLGSTNGTFINSRPIKEALLEAGYILRVGQIEMMLDAPPVTIAIPEIAPPEVEHANFLSDGTPACQNHSQIRAALQCQKCHKTYCIDCVKFLGRAGGRKLRLCPTCSGACEPIEVRRTENTQKLSFMSRISNSLRKAFQSRP